MKIKTIKFKVIKVLKIKELYIRCLYRHLNSTYRQLYFSYIKYQRRKKKGLKNDFTRSFLRTYGGKNGKYLYDKKCL